MTADDDRREAWVSDTVQRFADAVAGTVGLGLPPVVRGMAGDLEVNPSWVVTREELTAGLAAELMRKGFRLSATLAAAAGTAKMPPPNWVMRNKLMSALIFIVLAIMSTPAYEKLMPPEVREFLSQEEGPAAFCMALVASVTAAMAVSK